LALDKPVVLDTATTWGFALLGGVLGMGRFRRVAIVVVTGAGLIAAIASGSNSSSSGGKSGTTVAGQTGNAGLQDVTISKCVLADNQFEGPEATLTVTNHSSGTSNYLITVAFDSPNGGQQLDTGNATVQNLAANQSTTTTAPSLKQQLRSQPFTCKVASVDRFAAH
jgi:hypothetical protein